MDMIVCIKQVLDPEAPPSIFKVDSAANKVVQPPTVSLVIDPYSEFALEAALKIKDSYGGKITAIVLGTDLRRDVVRKPLSLGADDVILLEDPGFDDDDSWSTSCALSKAIENIGGFDIIFCGRESADWNAGQVGSGIAEILSIPSVTLAQKIHINDNKLKVRRRTDNGYEIVEVSFPVLITVSNEIGEPRYETIKGIIAAKKKKFITWKLADIGVDPSRVGVSARKSEMIKLFQPVREGRCEMIEGSTPEESGINLALRLREAKIL
jgi:electron transfer flavoprotein beta subunit